MRPSFLTFLLYGILMAAVILLAVAVAAYFRLL